MKRIVLICALLLVFAAGFGAVMWMRGGKDDHYDEHGYYVPVYDVTGGEIENYSDFFKLCAKNYFKHLLSEREGDSRWSIWVIVRNSKLGEEFRLPLLRGLFLAPDSEERRNEKKTIRGIVCLEADGLYWGGADIANDEVIETSELQKVEWDDFSAWLSAYVQRGQGWSRETYIIISRELTTEKYWKYFRELYESYPLDWTLHTFTECKE